MNKAIPGASSQNGSWAKQVWNGTRKRRRGARCGSPQLLLPSLPLGHSYFPPNQVMYRVGWKQCQAKKPPRSTKETSSVKGKTGEVDVARPSPNPRPPARNL